MLFEPEKYREEKRVSEGSGARWLGREEMLFLSKLSSSPRGQEKNRREQWKYWFHSLDTRNRLLWVCLLCTITLCYLVCVCLSLRAISAAMRGGLCLSTLCSHASVGFYVPRRIFVSISNLYGLAQCLRKNFTQIFLVLPFSEPLSLYYAQKSSTRNSMPQSPSSVLLTTEVLACHMALRVTIMMGLCMSIA